MTRLCGPTLRVVAGMTKNFLKWWFRGLEPSPSSKLLFSYLCYVEYKKLKQNI